MLSLNAVKDPRVARFLGSKRLGESALACLIEGRGSWSGAFKCWRLTRHLIKMHRAAGHETIQCV